MMVDLKISAFSRIHAVEVPFPGEIPGPKGGRRPQGGGLNPLAGLTAPGGRGPPQSNCMDPAQRTTRALPPFMSFSTSFCVAIDVSPGVVEANAPCAAP